MELDGHQKNQLFNFSDALDLMKEGYTMKRGNNDGSIRILLTPHFEIEYQDGKKFSWMASHIDILAEDWIIIAKVEPKGVVFQSDGNGSIIDKLKKI